VVVGGIRHRGTAPRHVLFTVQDLQREDEAMRALRASALICVSAFLAPAAWGYPTVYQEGVTIHNPGVAEGHVLFATQTGLLYLLDESGAVLHTWSPPCGYTGAVRPLEDGHVLVHSCGNLIELDWESQVVWQATPPGDCIFHHDWERLPSGNTLAMCAHTINEPALSDKPIVEDFLVELAPDGQVVWDWYLTDHLGELALSQDRLDFIAEVGNDFSHGNTVITIPENTPHADPRFQAGNIFVSFRHLNTIAIVDRGTGDVAWSMTDATIGQHGPHLIPGDLPGGGNVLVFDNGFAGDYAVVPNRMFSRVLEIDPLTKATVYSYTAEKSQDAPPHQGPLPRWSFFAPFISGAHRLANGNTFITEGTNGRLFEITPDSQIVWEYVNPFRGPVDNLNLIFRAYKVPYAFAGSSLTPDLVLSGSALGPAVAGQPLAYSVSVQNAGPHPAIGARLSAVTPPGTTFASIDAPPGWSCQTPPAGATGSIQCTSSSLTSGAAVAFTLTFDLGFCFRDAGVVAATMSASSDGVDATPADNALVIQSVAEGIDCDDGIPCTLDGCDPIAEQCVNVSICEATNDPCLDALCNTTTGGCEVVAALDGTACDDGDVATCADQCGAGLCAGNFVPVPTPVGDSVTLAQRGGTTTIEWTDDPGTFNVYGGALGSPGEFGYTHTCLNPAGPVGEMSFPYLADPPPGSAVYFLVTRVDQCRESGTGSDSGGTEHPDPPACGGEGEPGP
jgi:uncharacterized repeat protein (TIGR01451 family)